MMRVVKITGDREVVAIPIADADRIGKGHGVYQGFSAAGTLLYVGRTSNLPARLAHHRSQNPVWPDVAYLAWTPCDSYGEAVALERMAISTEPGDANIHQRLDLDKAKRASRMTLPAAARQRLVDTYALSDDPLMYEAASSYMRALREAGWTLQAIAGPLNITRERVRQRVAEAAQDLDIIVPAPPARAPKAAPRYRTWLWPAEQRQIDELYPLARQVNGATPEDDPRRAASVALSELFATLILRDVPARVIAEAAGCSVAAVNLRLARHGFRSCPPSQSAYTGKSIAQKRLLDEAECLHGHDLTVERAVRFINGDPSRPVCRACERVRSRAYYVRRTRTAAPLIPLRKPSDLRSSA